MKILEQYQLIGLENFMAYLDKHEPGNYKIKEASHTVPERNSLQTLRGIEVEDRRSLVVLGEAPTSITGLLTGGDSEETVARISTEGGNLAHGGFYEFIKIRVLQPISLSPKLIIPKSTIKIHVTAPEWTNPVVERRDHVRKLGLIWRRKDLSDILPDNLFLSVPEGDYDRVSREASYLSLAPQ